MSLLSKFIASKAPVMNRLAMEGLCYHRFLNAINYIDNYIKYSIATGTIKQNDAFYNTFISNAGVFTNKPMVTLTNGF